MDQSSLPASVRNLERIDPKFLDQNASFLVLPESDELAISDVRLSLEGLAAMMDQADSLNAKIRRAGGNPDYGVDIPPDSMAALLRILSEKLASAKDLPSLGMVQAVRPDLFNHRFGGV